MALKNKIKKNQWFSVDSKILVSARLFKQTEIRTILPRYWLLRIIREKVEYLFRL